MTDNPYDFTAPLPVQPAKPDPAPRMVITRWFLALLLGCTLLATGKAPLSGTSSFEYRLFDLYGVGPLFTLLGGVAFVSSGLAVVWCFSPIRGGSFFAKLAVGTCLSASLFGCVSWVSDWQSVQRVFIESREARGLSASGPALDLFEHTVTPYVVAGVEIARALLLLWLILRLRNRYRGTAGESRKGRESTGKVADLPVHARALMPSSHMIVGRLILTIIFGFSALLCCAEMASPDSSFNFRLYNGAGIPGIFYPVAWVQLVLYATVVVWCWLRIPRTALFAKLAVIAYIVSACGHSAMIGMDWRLAKRAFIQSCDARGIAVSGSRLDFLESPFAPYSLAAFAVVIGLFMMWLVVRLQNNFEMRAFIRESGIVVERPSAAGPNWPFWGGLVGLAIGFYIVPPQELLETASKSGFDAGELAAPLFLCGLAGIFVGWLVRLLSSGPLRAMAGGLVLLAVIGISYANSDRAVLWPQEAVNPRHNGPERVQLGDFNFSLVVAPGFQEMLSEERLRTFAVDPRSDRSPRLAMKAHRRWRTPSIERLESELQETLSHDMKLVDDGVLQVDGHDAFFARLHETDDGRPITTVQYFVPGCFNVYVVTFMCPRSLYPVYRDSISRVAQTIRVD